MSTSTPWQKAAEAQGTTESEQVLARLARKAFLSLWSYPNVYSDEGRARGKGDGKELVDLMVVFGNDVLLFSDKSCSFQLDVDVKVAWPRWYKRAIEKSARQLAGAEAFLKRFPGRVFVDKSCQTKLPVAIPDASVARYFLIAVTRGGHAAAARHFGGGSSGSPMLNSSLVGHAHHHHPFEVGFPLDDRRFVHVLDEVTLEALLDELDTLPDFVDYLACKERFFGRSGLLMHIPGEEELFAWYMRTLEDGQHAFPDVPAGFDGISFAEGEWDHYIQSPQRAAKRKADEGSYLWDSLIEYQASYVRAGTAVGHSGGEASEVDHERILRALASESRLARRQLAKHLRHALWQGEPGKKFARMFIIGEARARAYVFLVVPNSAEEDYQAYRKMRSATLFAYCAGLKLKYPQLVEAIGIASEPCTEVFASQDFMYVDLTEEMDSAQVKNLEEAMRELDVLQTPDENLRYGRSREFEFPIPFASPREVRRDGPSGPPMNRAERRRMARDRRRAAKRSGKAK
ncbi:hypothetical protein [Thiomonas sp. FB-6]|uniref:hypothetical protein n=1 Tax=Thiomonas sp. FB-6 TaxID=1158291 RepID=UPI0003A22048|nr:hypothetical protein [Thiomonas sp. FB-6]